MKVIQCEVGRAICRHMRDLLEGEKFSGTRIDWHEGSGWFSRVFTIKGDEADVDRVEIRLRHWFNCMNHGGVK